MHGIKSCRGAATRVGDARKRDGLADVGEQRGCRTRFPSARITFLHALGEEKGENTKGRLVGRVPSTMFFSRQRNVN